jgi:serine/threonine protein kinase
MYHGCFTNLPYLQSKFTLNGKYSRKMPPPISLAGRVMDGTRIKLGPLIGSGGFGAVYHAVHLDTGAEYAVKVIRKRDNPYYRRELHLHGVVSKHPNIVTLHQVLESSHSIYIILDYCAGGDLFDAMAGNCIYAGKDELIKSVFLQLLDAVGHCHSLGVYHRDLKPENILCNKDATQLFLVDFGLATESGHSQSLGCGSLHYMSPGTSLLLLASQRKMNDCLFQNV